MFKQLIKEVSLAIELELPDDLVLPFSCGNCKYKVHVYSLPSFLAKLNKGGVLHKPTFARLRRPYHNMVRADGSRNL